MQQKKVKVNGQIIPEEAIQFELERLVRFYVENGMTEEQIKGQLAVLVERATEQAVGTKLLMEEAVRRNEEVSEEEIEEQLDKVIEQVGGVDAFKNALAQQKIDEAAFREQLKEGRRIDRLIQSVVKEVADPSEEEIKKYYDEHQDQFVTGERVLAQHILVTPDGSEATSKADARDKILAIKERVVQGADFGEEAAQHSMCPSGKEGGSLGWFAKGMMVPEFDNAVFSMGIGDVSDVVETQFGYHLIYKTDHEEASSCTYEEARPKILELLRHAQRGEAVTAFVEQLKQSAAIEYI